ncbi:MAG: hypothetical protein GY862_37955 [Gammaproteobacteria bacterium]|nr:hypothetical protein [Gammaproteobacteria bacterium]
MNTNERIAVLLALAGQESVSKGECLSDTQLAEFMGGRLKGKEHKQVLQHFQACDTCYRNWQETANALQAEPLWLKLWVRLRAGKIRTFCFGNDLSEKCREFPKHGSAESPKLTRSQYRLMGIRDAVAAFFISRNGTGWRPVPALSAAAVMTLGVVLLFKLLAVGQPGYEEAYRELAGQHRQAAQIALQAFSPPWEEHALSFAAANPALEERAFVAGVWHGRETLLGHTTDNPPPAIMPPAEIKAWSASDWAGYFDLGQWVMLSWTVLQFEEAMPASFWQQQKQRLLTLQIGFSEQAEVNPLLTQTLTEWGETDIPASKRQLNKRLRSMINRLSP